MEGSGMRFWAMLQKEIKLLFRDGSSLTIGLILPLVMITVIPSGLSLDMKNLPVAVVMKDNSPSVRNISGILQATDLFTPYYVYSVREAEVLLENQTVDAVIAVQPDATASFYAGRGNLQLIVSGADAITAHIIRSYLEGALLMGLDEYVLSLPGETAMGNVTLAPRLWFNEAASSTWYLIPGIIMYIITIAGVFLTMPLIAREWESGTIEALFVTPAKIWEILLTKMIPYFGLCLCSLFLCLVYVWICYDVPVRGSFFLIIIASMLYIVSILAFGLLISSVARSQYLAAQLANMLTLLPALMTTGFIYDLRCAPFYAQVIGSIVPATYYLELLKSLFLSGNNWRLFLHHGLILCGFAVLFFGLSVMLTRKRIK